MNEGWTSKLQGIALEISETLGYQPRKRQIKA
jgi:hypothetical protein